MCVRVCECECECAMGNRAKIKHSTPSKYSSIIMCSRQSNAQNNPMAVGEEYKQSSITSPQALVTVIINHTAEQY